MSRTAGHGALRAIEIRVTAGDAPGTVCDADASCTRAGAIFQS
jgi:hypothetical protein